jgi:hypothetical protein
MTEFLVFLLIMASCEEKRDTTQLSHWEFVKVRGECFMVNEPLNKSSHFKCLKGKPLPTPDREYK